MARSGTAPVPRGQAADVLRKASEFLESADNDLDQHRWTAAGLGAIHAGMTAADAALIAQTGLRSTSQNHGVVVELLDDHVADFSAAQRRQLTGLLKMKNTVAYEQRTLAEVESRQLVDSARRLVRWADALLGSDETSRP
jgi:HEPN domain-containing protein